MSSSDSDNENLPLTQPLTEEGIQAVEQHQKSLARYHLWGLLTPLEDNKDGLVRNLSKDKEIVGRNDFNNLDTNIRVSISRQQFAVERVAGKFRIKNLSATVSMTINFLRDLPPGGEWILANGDVICIGIMKVFQFKDTKIGDFPASVKEKYLVRREIGSGGYGTVFEGMQMDGKKVAIKKMKGSTDTNKYLEREVDLLQKLNHPCVVKFIDYVESHKYGFIIMEYLEGRDLLFQANQVFKKLIEFDERIVKLHVFQIMKGLQYLHRNKIVHRDIKLENVLLATTKRTGLVKIVDFGGSKHDQNNTVLNSFIGTMDYIAPEVLNNYCNDEPLSYTEKVDCWSVGCLLYAYLSGMSAFGSTDKDKRVVNIKQGQYQPMIGRRWILIKNQAKSLVTRLLTCDPEKRASIGEALGSKWFASDPDLLVQAKKLMAGELDEVDMESTTRGQKRVLSSS